MLPIQKLTAVLILLFSGPLVCSRALKSELNELLGPLFYRLLRNLHRGPVIQSTYCDEQTCYDVTDVLVNIEYRPQVFRALNIRSAFGAAHSTTLLKKKDFSTSSLKTSNWLPDKSSFHYAAYHYVQCEVFAWNNVLNSKRPGNLLIIGLGGGIFNNFFETVYPLVNITVVELNPLMPVIAREWFGLNESGRLKVVVQDGVDFLRDAARNNHSFDAIILDATYISHNNDFVAPVAPFHANRVIEDMAHVLGPNGMLAINTVVGMGRPHTILNSFVGKFQNDFEEVVVQNIDGFNQVTVCSQKPIILR